MKKVLVCWKMPEVAIPELEGFQVDMSPEEDGMSRGSLLENVSDVHGIIPLVTHRIDDEVFDAAPNLEVVSNYAVGVDNVDLEAARRRGIRVTNTPEAVTETTADHTFALILSASRRIPECDRYVRAGKWEKWSPYLLLGNDIHGKVLGIVGMGRIGKAVARRAAGFGMTVLYTDVAEMNIPGAIRVPFDDLLSRSDIITAHVPLMDGTGHLFDVEAFSKMKVGVTFVNVSRGPVVDEQALVDALKCWKVCYAALDVYENEPSIHPDLLEMENVVLVPHIGTSTHGARERMAIHAARDCAAVLHGDKPMFPVV